MKRLTARALRKNLKLEFAAHHFVHHSKTATEIGFVVNVSPERVCRWCTTHEWRLALKLWGYPASHSPFVDDYYEYANTPLSNKKDFLIEAWASIFDNPEIEWENVVDLCFEE